MLQIILFITLASCVFVCMCVCDREERGERREREREREREGGGGIFEGVSEQVSACESMCCGDLKPS